MKKKVPNKKRDDKKLILLIEDDLPIIDVYTFALENLGKFETKFLRYGFEVLDWLKKLKEKKEKKPELILLDLILPDANGLDLLKEIRKSEDAREIPVFIVTNYTNRELEKVGYDLKSEKYLTKTKFTPGELVKMVQEELKKNK